MDKKFTKKNYFEMIIETLESGVCPIEDAELIDFCEKQINLLDKKNTKKVDDPWSGKIYEVLSDNEFMTLAEIVIAVGEADLTLNKASYRLNSFVKNGAVEKEPQTIKDENGTRKIMGYRKIMSKM